VNGDPPAKLYSVFISYSHADEARAAWLQQRLEAYQIPGSLVGRQGPFGLIGHRFARVFRDAAELSVGDLSAEINEALGRAHALVAVCSPAAAASPWVGREIARFKTLASPPRIFPVIVGGEPHAQGKVGFSAADECFPRALTCKVTPDGEVLDEPDTEFIAADLRPGHDGEETGFLRLAAGLLGVGLDDLVQREKQAERRRRLMWTGIAAGAGALALVASVAAGIAFYQQARAHEALVELLPEEGRVILENEVAMNAVRRVGLARAARFTLAGLALGPEHRHAFRSLLGRLLIIQGMALRHPMIAACPAGGAPTIAPDHALDSAGARLAMVCPDGAVHVWDLANGRDLSVLARPGVKPIAATFGADDQSLLIAAADASVRPWTIGAPAPGPANGPDAAAPVAAVAGAGGGIAILADRAPAPLGSAVSSLLAAHGALSIATAADGHVAVVHAGAPAVVTIEPPGGGTPVVLKDVLSLGVRSVALTPDGTRTVTTDQEGRIRIWDALDGRSMIAIPTTAKLLNASLSGDGRRLAILEPDKVIVWDVAPLGESLPALVSETCRVLLPTPKSRIFPKAERAKDPLILELWREEGFSDNTDLCTAATKVARAAKVRR
jgi:hypothetical protein